MKANELMIGDWVKAKDIEYAQISFIDQYGDIGLDMKDESKNPFQEQEIDPIPLTDEILEANGFEKFGDCCLHKLQLEEERIIIQANLVYIEIYSTSRHERMLRLHSVKFHVHQLQHALRLCGLNEVADNFKIE